MKLIELHERAGAEFDKKTMVLLKPIYYVAKDEMDAQGADDYLRKWADRILWGDEGDSFEDRVKSYDGDLSKWVYRSKGKRYTLEQDGDHIEDRPDGAMWDADTLKQMIGQGAIRIE